MEIIVQSKTHGERVLLIDEEDYFNLSKCKLRILRAKTNYYIRCIYRDEDDTLIYVYLHRLILGVAKHEKVDHINGNGLDNRRENLRVASSKENSQNRSKTHNTSSQYKGVAFDKVKGKWQVKIRANDTNIGLGYFDSEEDAARQYDYYALKYFGEFAKLNFPHYDYSTHKPKDVKDKSKCTSKYKGVCKRKYKWQACCFIPQTKINKHIGYFDSEKEAAIAYNDFIVKNGINRRLNDIED